MKERLVNFTVLLIELSRQLYRTSYGKNLTGQLERSGASVALNFGEALEAESKRDFIHKMNIILKELRETELNLRIIQKAGILNNTDNLISAIGECNELIAIFVVSIKTAKHNLALKGDRREEK
ncbi:MAG: four helix bundle protein [Bacteroidales bacterium]|nr:four helix bundle protein [Lentimicrobiaceae bacterium]MDD5694100.1 four helix bundle protein [Bacteroidales bacterium]